MAARPIGHHQRAADSETLASQVEDNGGIYFVPAFSGSSPRTGAPTPAGRSSAVAVQLNAHIARATLEAICYQSRDVVEAMEADSGVKLEVLKVDGGVTLNELCVQIQANVLGVDVVRPKVPETTALGAAYAAGLAVGYWSDPEDLRANWQEDRRWSPQWTPETAGTKAMRAGIWRLTAPWAGVNVSG